ncbi:hypothetical protein HDU67_008957 [Dinochytrium kinnereticum]|nr:hypothetical protein HDU67_008957 [Dinochytrium kinnereticum]
MNHIKLTDTQRSVRIEIPAFSAVIPGQTISYGSVPFLIFGRKWGLNVYPHGLRPASKDYGQRIDIYVHIWAKDSTETEAQFLSWVRENNLHFNLIVTEPEPVALHTVQSSEGLWCDMEDEAGWWLFSLKASSRLLELTNDTLIVEMQFQPRKPTSPTITPKPLLDSKGQPVHAPKTSAPPIPVAPFPTLSDPTLEVFFDNKLLHDLTIYCGNKKIYLQRSFVSQKLSRFSTIHSKSVGGILIDAPYDVAYAFFSFAYTGKFVLDRSADSYAHLYLLSEMYGENNLRRYCGRELYGLLRADIAVTLLCAFGGRSISLQEFLVAYIIHNISEVMATDNFKRMFSGPRVRKSRRLLAILRRMETNPVDGMKPTISPSVGGEVVVSASSFDGKHSAAFRSLLMNPDVADVHFLVEGRYIYAQKSVLSAVLPLFPGSHLLLP